MCHQDDVRMLSRCRCRGRMHVSTVDLIGDAEASRRARKRGSKHVRLVTWLPISRSSRPAASEGCSRSTNLMATALPVTVSRTSCTKPTEPLHMHKNNNSACRLGGCTKTCATAAGCAVHAQLLCHCIRSIICSTKMTKHYTAAVRTC